MDKHISLDERSLTYAEILTIRRALEAYGARNCDAEGKLAEELGWAFKDADAVILKA